MVKRFLMKELCQEEMSKSILNSVLPSARGGALLFGYTTTKWDELYVSVKCNDATYSIVRKALPNNFSRMYLVCIDGTPVGSVLFVEIATNILHMVGMFVTEASRGKKITYKKGAKECRQTVASFLLQHVMDDLVASNCQVTLEVMNNNQNAHKLYEKGAFFAKGNEDEFRFELCSKTEVIEYAKIRRKKITKWHDIGYGESRAGIQWSHIPDYNGESTWSISRVYNIPKHKQRVSAQPMAFTKNKLKLIYSALRFGELFEFIKYIVASLKKYGQSK